MTGRQTAPRADEPVRRGETRKETRREQADRTAAELKRAARAVFAERGYLNAKITDITAAAGRAAGSFYNHFRSKEDLLATLLTDLFDAGDDAVLDPESAHSPDFTRAEAIRWHVEGYWGFAEDNADVLTALNQAALVDADFARRMREIVAVQQQDLLGHLDFVTAAGATLPGDRVATMTAMFDMMIEFQRSWTRSGGFDASVSREAAIDMLTTFIHRGLNG